MAIITIINFNLLHSSVSNISWYKKKKKKKEVNN